MKVFLDSCFLTYMNTMTDDERTGIDSLFRKLLDEQLFINVLVVDEVLYTSRKYGVKYGTTLEFLRNIVIPYTEIIEIGEEDMKPIEKYLISYDLKPSDAIRLATMDKIGASHIVSEDEDFDRVKGIRRIWLGK